jgi:hypothetical protein
MNVKDYLKSKNIWLGTKVADMNAPENYFDLENLLEDYHQAKLKLFVIADLQAVEKALSIMAELIQYHSHCCEVEMNEEKSIMNKAVQSLQKISNYQ